MQTDKTVYLLGYASGIAGSKEGSGEGPDVMQHSSCLLALKEQEIPYYWQTTIKRDTQNHSKLAIVTEACQALADEVIKLIQQEKFFTVIGGDHTSAIGTWSAASASKHDQGPLGLIWIDAHMDSHTPETSETGNLHGMPMACLLGAGSSALINMAGEFTKFRPEHVCLIGVRSFEQGEVELLDKLNVRIFYMPEVKQRGLKAVLADAIKIATHGTAGYGISIDIDSMDPADAPGTGVAEPDGLAAKELCQVLTGLAQDERLIGAEIAEFNPRFDKNQMTEKLIAQLLAAICAKKQTV
ncbi:MAG: arginase [Gammaproteobacteria bacterium]